MLHFSGTLRLQTTRPVRPRPNLPSRRRAIRHALNAEVLRAGGGKQGASTNLLWRKSHERLKRPRNRPCREGISVRPVFLGLMATAAAAVVAGLAVGQPAREGEGDAMRFGDILWAWGNPEMTEPGRHDFASFAQAGPGERARILGVPNVVMAGLGLPNDTQEAERLTAAVSHCPRLVWEISADGEGGPPCVCERRVAQIRGLVAKYPPIEAVMLDDMSTVQIDKGLKPSDVADLRDGFDVAMDGSRRLIWRLAMAGGMGGFFGYYSQWFNKWGPFKGKYPNPEQFRTHRTFWKDRLLLDMECRNDLTDGHCLASPSGRHYVFYKEQTASIRIDLTGAAEPLPAVAVDTKADYQEIALGTLAAAKQTWSAPHESDWAIAVGRFRRRDTHTGEE